MQVIYYLGDKAGVAFAAQELSTYLKKITANYFPIQHTRKYNPSKPGIWLGVCDTLPGSDKQILTGSRWDDTFLLEQQNDRLFISGSNGRSVLYGVYAYLERLGVRWVRPGLNGELVPTLGQLPVEPFVLTESASYRHRGICIEGAPSLEHALAMVDWMAKRRMNSFFLQFQHSGTFWGRWYSHPNNPYYRDHQNLTDADFYALDEKVITAVKERGMILHRVGHGWTAATIDMPHNGWEQTELEVAPDKQRWLARLNSRRALYQRIPINTELCYSYKPAFTALVDKIITYARAHAEVDVLHIWLSDAMNNKCECRQCASMSPADWYVKLVNVLADRLYEVDPERRFVFLSYFESWWAPRKLSVESTHGNAILMFAPISRCFRHSLSDPACTDKFSLRRPPLNHAAMPRTNHAFIGMLEKWRQTYQGDSFLFDYYLWSGLHTQVSDVSLAKVIHHDMRALQSLGLNGVVSCQVMRSFWPTGLTMAAMADTTWNRSVRWQTVKQAHFDAAYGPDASWVSQYLIKLEKLLLGRPDHTGGERMEAKQPRQLRNLEAFLVKGHMEIENRTNRATLSIYRESFKLLAHHNQFLLMKCLSILGKVQINELKEWLLKSEIEINPFLDVPALMAMQIPK